MSNYSRHTKYAIAKFLVIVVPFIAIIIVWMYGKIVWKGWPAIGVLLSGLALFLGHRSQLIAAYTDEEEKFIEVADDYLKMVEPSKKYEGFIRFKDVHIAELSSNEGETTRIIFRMNNQQKIVVAGYDGLEHAAEVIKKFSEIEVIET